jgi:hypothetical protein
VTVVGGVEDAQTVAAEGYVGGTKEEAMRLA